MSHHGPAFIYKHRTTGSIKCVYEDEAEDLQDMVGWQHIASVSPAIFIEVLLNDHPEIVEELEG